MPNFSSIWWIFRHSHAVLCKTALSPFISEKLEFDFKAIIDPLIFLKPLVHPHYETFQRQNEL
jgi:hypothetical protein